MENINSYGEVQYRRVCFTSLVQNLLLKIDFYSDYCISLLLDMCDFAKDNCGWTGHASEVYLSRYMLICGRNGKLIDCILKTRFQDGDTWTPRQIGSINYIGKPLLCM